MNRPMLAGKCQNYFDVFICRFVCSVVLYKKVRGIDKRSEKTILNKSEKFICKYLWQFEQKMLRIKALNDQEVSGNEDDLERVTKEAEVSI